MTRKEFAEQVEKSRIYLMTRSVKSGYDLNSNGGWKDFKKLKTKF